MPVVNKINRMLNFPMNSSERVKKEIWWSASCAMINTDSGIAPYYGLLPTDGSFTNTYNIITYMNTYGDYIYRQYINYKYVYHIITNNGDNTYTEISQSIYTDQQITDAINDGNQYVVYKSLVPVYICNDTIMYAGCYHWSTNQQQCKSILVVTDKNTNAIKKIIIMYDSKGANFTFREYQRTRTNQDGTKIAIITGQYDESFSSNDGDRINIINNNNGDIQYISSIGASSYYPNLGEVQLINDKLLYESTETVEYTLNTYGPMTVYYYCLINSNSLTIIQRKFWYSEGSDDSYGSGSYNIQLVNSNVKYLLYQYWWNRYSNFTRLQIYDYTDPSVTNNIGDYFSDHDSAMNRNIVKYNYQNNCAYHFIKNTLYKTTFATSVTNEVSTALFTYLTYPSTVVPYGLLNIANY